jgi:hypothetical protein
MRIVSSCFLAGLAASAVIACGGAPKHAATDGADTSSLESPGGGDSSSSSSSSSSPSSGTASSASGSSGAASSGSASAAPSPAASGSDAAAAPAANHPVPGATGSIDGQPFSPKLAQVAGPLQKDGRLLIVLHEGSDCVTSTDAKPGDGTMMLMVPWQDGYKVDLASLRTAKKRDKGEASFVRIGPDKKNQVSTTFKPTGRLTVVSAPTAQNAFGKIKIDLQSGDYMLAGDLDVKVCSPPK